jgi:hypothetical protein
MWNLILKQTNVFKKIYFLHQFDYQQVQCKFWFAIDMTCPSSNFNTYHGFSSSRG